MRFTIAATVVSLVLSGLSAVASAGTPPIRTFVGRAIIDEGLDLPTDPEMAVGPGRVVLVYNSSLMVLDKDGTVLKEKTFQDLLSFQGTLQDGEVVYDPTAGASGEYFVVIMRTGSRYFSIGVLGPEPEDESDWKFYTVSIGTGRRVKVDQPNLTVQDDVILVWSANIHPMPRRAVAVVIDKAALVARGVLPPPAIIVDEEQSGGPMSPISGPSSMNQGTPFLLTAQLLESDTLTAEMIRLRAMLDPQTVFTTDPANHFTEQADVGIEQIVYELNVATTSNSAKTWVDFRSRNELANGNLWLVHTIRADHNQSIVRWYQIDLHGWPADRSRVPCIVRSGDISPPPAVMELDPTASAFMPSIDVNKYATAVVAFLVAGEETPLALYASAKLPSQTAFGEGSAVLAGVAGASGPSGASGAFRFDYARVDTDAANPHVFWTHHPMIGSGPDRAFDGRSTWVAAFAPIYCPADLTGSSVSTDIAYGVPDGAVDTEDFFYFLDLFVAGNLEVDLSGTVPGEPDFELTVDDSKYFLSVFNDPCEPPVSTTCQ